MKKLVAVSTACLVVIAFILVYNTWSDYRRGREIEAAMANPPPRFKASVPPESATPDPSSQVVISIDDAGRLMLNDREAGTTEDVTLLRSQLELMFKERGGAQPDRTVWVKASSKLKYREVKKVIDVVKDAGANPVGLQTDDLK
jgi:biopolymer transport protein ExbD